MGGRPRGKARAASCQSGQLPERSNRHATGAGPEGVPNAAQQGVRNRMALLHRHDMAAFAVVGISSYVAEQFQMRQVRLQGNIA